MLDEIEVGCGIVIFSSRAISGDLGGTALANTIDLCYKSGASEVSW